MYVLYIYNIHTYLWVPTTPRVYVKMHWIGQVTTPRTDL